MSILVNNAGGVFASPILETTENGWDALYRANLRHVLLCTQRVARAMVAAGIGGSITTVTSIEGVRAAPGYAAYAAAKAGVINYTKTAALELAPHRIRVNALAPDITLTEGIREVAPPGLRGALPPHRADGSRWPRRRDGRRCGVPGLGSGELHHRSDDPRRRRYPRRRRLVPPPRNRRVLAGTDEWCAPRSNRKSTSAEAILEATRRVIAERGSGKLTLSAIAATAGVSRPTLYRWFPTKEALLDALTIYEEERFVLRLQAVIEVQPTPARRLDAALRCLVTYLDGLMGPDPIGADPGFAIQSLGSSLAPQTASFVRLARRWLRRGAGGATRSSLAGAGRRAVPASGLLALPGAPPETGGAAGHHAQLRRAVAALDHSVARQTQRAPTKRERRRAP